MPLNQPSVQKNGTYLATNNEVESAKYRDAFQFY